MHPDLPLRDRLLILLRSKLWRSERQLSLATSRRVQSDAVGGELDLMQAAGLVMKWDSSKRWKLTVLGMNAAKRAWESKQKRRAA